MMRIIFLLSLLLARSNASVQDFCIADLKLAQTPAGYPCIRPTDVKASDFVFSLGTPGNTSNMIGAAITPGFVDQFPALNGQGLSTVRVDIAPKGFIPMHSHPGSSELVYVQEGFLTAGLISSANDVYVQRLKAGDVIMFPQGLLHFLINEEESSPALAIATFNSANPRLQFLDATLFANNLPTEFIARTTFLDPITVSKLKGAFGGTDLKKNTCDTVE